MVKSLLNAVGGVDSLIFDVFIILAVVIACALVVYFLWEIFSNVAHKNKKETEQSATATSNSANKDVVVIDYSLNKEEEPAKEEASLIDETKMTEVDEVKAEEEKSEVEQTISDEEKANAERRAYLEARRQELIRRMQAEMEEEKEEVQEEEEVEPETVEQSVEEEPTEETVEEVDSLTEEKEALVAEKAKYEAMVKELEAAKQALAEQKPETIMVEVPVASHGALSLDELKTRLAACEAKLASTEKELRACKKEYSPLHRVWTTHERDEKKLRRKEALVAKQKVVLYGVNNYADIDEEKAKKLAEDLDLLDGLKLSVQHCEEVMKKNAERYPLLEKMYNVLNTRNEELKADIAYYKAEIAKLEAEAESESEQN